jgi:type IV pilus assembly protein PilQ
VALSVRRSPEGVELVIEGTGAAPVLQQSRDGQAWRGELRIGAPSGLRLGPQRLTLPDAGLQSVSLQGSGSDYAIEVVPVQGAPLARPVVSADGRNLVITFPAAAVQPTQRTASLNLQDPGRVPQNSFAPPLQSRAVAPPLGDMAVGSMVLRNQSYVNVSGPNVTLTLRNAPAKDALMSIAQLGGYGFVFVDDQPASTSQGSQSPVIQNGSSAVVTGPSTVQAGRSVTMAFRNESYARALNSILLAAGLQGKKDGNTILVGVNVLGKGFGSQISKVYRLNQASASSAADYLASLGASITKISVITNSVSQGTPLANDVAGSQATQQTQKQDITTTETYGGGLGPLRGLIGTTDSRLQTITLIGDSSQVSVAENYLRQLDLRQRQVALTVRILDVNLDNSSEIDNSFAFRYGSNFIVNDQGRLLAAFGKNLPAQSSSFDQFEETTQTSASARSSGGSRNTSSSRASSEGQSSSAGSSATTQASDSVADTYQLTDTYTTEELKKINDVLQKTSGTVVYKNDVTGKYETLPVPANDGYREATETNISNITNLISAITGRETSASRTNTSSNTRSDGSDASSGSSSQSGRSSNAQSDRSSNKNKSSTSRKRPNPGLNYPDSEFYDFLQAQIVSRSTKILASPTLILQEGDEPYSGSDSERISTDGKVGRSRTNEAFVRVGTQYVTAYAVRQDINGNNFCEPKFGNAGLTFGARVDKIDDNGFVTFSLSPEISAAIGTQQIDRCGIIYQINDRLLDTGKVRVRDGQTLILTGVISDEDRSVVTKWPILGDLPLVGQFFRRSSGDRRKSELVIMVTPRVIKDDQGGMYGYGYQPATNDARGFVYSGG